MAGGRVHNSYRAVVEYASAGRAIQEALAGKLVVHKQSNITLCLLDKHGGVSSAAGSLRIYNVIVVKSAVRIAFIGAEIINKLTCLSGAAAENAAVRGHKCDRVDIGILLCKLSDEVSRLVGTLFRGYSSLNISIIQDSVHLIVHSVYVRLKRVALVIYYLVNSFAELLVAV